MSQDLLISHLERVNELLREEVETLQVENHKLRTTIRELRRGYQRNPLQPRCAVSGIPGDSGPISVFTKDTV